MSARAAARLRAASVSQSCAGDDVESFKTVTSAPSAAIHGDEDEQGSSCANGADCLRSFIGAEPAQR